MRKKLIVGLMMASALVFASNAMAEDVTPTVGSGKLVIGTAQTSEDITIGLSKGVEVRYYNPGTTPALSQWYVAGSVHSGGNRGYATAENLTNMMVKLYNPGDATSTILDSIPLEEASAQDWPTGWDPQ